MNPASQPGAQNTPRRSRASGTSPGGAAPGGFTLLEITAVLAVIAILAATLVPGILRRIQQAAITKERADLAALAGAIQTGAALNRALPGAGNWAAFVGNVAGKGAGAVSVNPRGNTRVFLVNPALQLGAGALPFAQTTNGIAEPVNAQIMILSSLSGALPLSSGTPLAAVFNQIWNTPPETVPSGWTNYAGAGEDLLIQRMNLRPLFQRLVLVNNDERNPPGRFSIDGSAPREVLATGTGWDAYYLTGTVLGLHRPDGTNLVLQMQEVLSGDVSYIYEHGYWQTQLYHGRRRVGRGLQFAEAVQYFLNQPRNPGADFGASPQAVMDQMYMYLFIYTLWANDTPCFSRSGSVNLVQVPQYQMLGNARTLLDQVSYNLLK